MKPIILVDGSSYLYRAFHALPPLATRLGTPTGAVHGVVGMLKLMLKTWQPEYVGVIFDAKGKTFRDDLYPAYKAHRPPMPDDMRVQIEPLHALIRALGLPLIVEEGVEADDVIGTLARQAEAEGRSVLISTGDKDMAQLVSPLITLVNTMTKTTLDPSGVEAKFGVRPDQIIDYLSLMGDSVDNVPGVPGVGPKTAIKLLQEYGSLANLMANADAIKGKVGENLRAHLDQLPLAQQLTTIKCDVTLHETLEDLRVRAPDNTALLQLYTDLEFSTWRREIENADDAPEQQPEPVQAEKGKYHTVMEQSQLDSLIAKLEASAQFSVDTETTSLDYMQAEIVGLSFCLQAGEAWYIPVDHRYMGAPPQLNREHVLSLLKPVLENSAIGKIGQHLKYDTHVLQNYGVQLKGILFDTMLASYVLDATATRHNMDDMAAHYLNYKTVLFTDIAGKGVKQLTFDQIAIEQASDYAAEDADITLRLHDTLAPALCADEKLLRVFTEMELPVASILQKMEHRGILLDGAQLATQSRELGRKILELEQQAYEIAGQEFNLGSPKQLGNILYEKLGIPAPKKTATGQYSTSEDVLEQLDHPLPRLLLQHRSLSKLKSTYTDKLPEMVNKKTGRVHTSYHQAVAATGRLASSDPNLQNIPVRTEEGRKIREAFIAAPGYQLLSADYSQIELRIMAHLSDDPGLLAAFSHGEDVHRATAAEVFGVPRDQVTSDMRRNAKAINFGLIYGMSAFGLARQLNIPRQEAQAYIDLYFARYPGVRHYMDTIRAEAARQGYVETLFGRRLMVREINNKNQAIRQGAERAAINAPMQGTAADIIKLAMIRVDRALDSGGLDANILLQVHDELVVEVRDDQIDAATALLTTEMSAAATLKVPLLVEVGHGRNWNEAH